MNRMPQRRQGNRRPHQSSQGSEHVSVLKKHLDINCDLGQSFGIYQNHYEEKILPYVTSVNIACGGHAGDPLTISKAIDMSRNHNVSIGALIGYNDPIGNGQREMYLGVDELRAMILYQLGALHSLLHSKGLEIRHVRTHGFLYRQLYTDQLIAETVAKAIAEFSRWIILVGLTGPILANACSTANIKIGQEVLISRRYRKDGTILPYNKTIDGKNFIEEAAQRTRQLIQSGTVVCEDKTKIRVNVDTIHVPSDSEESVELARTVRAMIAEPKPIHLEKYEKYFADLSVLK